MKKRTMAWAMVCVVLLIGHAGADSLFNKKAEDRGSLITEDTQEFEPGDLITVLVRENIDANTSADTDTQKQSDLESDMPATDNPFVLQGPFAGRVSQNDLPNWVLESQKDHSAQGETSRTNSLVMTIACTVERVYPNGNIDIVGRKRVTVNREDSEMFVAGTVRAKDVTPANTVDSGLIANATVELKGKGPLWNNQRRGILTKILDWFSPF